MASTSDIRDIMDMGHDRARHAMPKKKKRLLEAQPRLTGISREVQALMGDSVPPVAIVDTPKYKSKPSMAMKLLKVRHWEDRSFSHGARKDGLQLRHWKRSIPGAIMPPTVAANGSPDTETSTGNDTTPAAAAEVKFEEEYPSEKWNVRVQVISYTDDQYEKYFKADDWSKEETDYLIQLCGDFDLRWILIADRYDPSEIPVPTSPDGQATPANNYTQRTMEALKSRYYTIASKMLEIHTPASQMTGDEFQLWEKMRNFDAKAEITRKTMAEKLFERTKDEAEEEKMLLEELHRITKNEEDFIKLRKDLYSRLETAPSLRRNERGEEQSTALYQTAQGLSHLLSNLLSKEKRLKRPIQNGPDAASAAATPSDTKGRQPPYHRRETMESQADESGPSKKGSVSHPIVRSLTSAEEAKYGVSHPQERLTSGVMFRHEKINRVTTAKSQVQTQKIQAALTELGIPARLLMPTERVCREFERLVTEVQLLLDTRRVSEKVASEVKVLEEHKRIRLGLPKEKEDAEAGTSDAMDVDAEVQANQGDVEGTANANGETNGIKSQAESVAADDSVMLDRNAKDLTNEEDEDEDEEGADKSVNDDEDAERSVANGQDEDDEDAEEEDGDAQVDEDDEEEDDDAPGLEDLEKANEVTDEDEAEDEEEEEEEDDAGNDESEVGDSEEEVDNEGDGEEDQAGAEVDESIAGDGGDEDGDEDEEDEEDEEDNDNDAAEELSRPTSANSASGRSHKRSASVLSEASRTGSNRSGAGRKKRR